MSDANKYAACLLHLYKVFFFLVMLIICTMEEVVSLRFHFHGAGGGGIEGPETGRLTAILSLETMFKQI